MIFPCPICGGTGWKVLHRQGDQVLPENWKELESELLRGGLTISPCFYACTTYVSCDCRIIKVESKILTVPVPPWFRQFDCGATNDHIVQWNTPESNRTHLAAPAYQAGDYLPDVSCSV